MLRSRLSRVFAVAFALITSVVGNCAVARAQSTLIPAPSRFDFAYDVARDVVYISSDSQILRYRVADGVFLPPISMGGFANGIDLSPDGNTLVVADAVPFYDAFGTGERQGRIVLIDLETLVQTNKTFSLLANETGSYSVAFDYLGNVLISPRISSWDDTIKAPLRRYFAANNSVGTFGESGTSNPLQLVAPRTLITRNNDGTVLGFGEVGSSGVDWGKIGVGDNMLQRFNIVNSPGTPSAQVFGIATDGTGWFLPTSNALLVRNAQNQPVGSIGSSTPTADILPSAIAIDSGRHLAYVAYRWDRNIEIRDTTSRAVLQKFTGETGTGWPDSTDWNGHLRVAPNGRFLMQSQSGGVRLFELQNGLPLPTSYSLTTPEDTRVSMSLPNPYPGSANVTYTITQYPLHGGIADDLPNADYFSWWNYYGADSFTYLVSDGTNSQTITVPITVTPVEDPFVASDITQKTRIGTPTELYLSAYDPDNDIWWDWNNYAYPLNHIEIVTPPAHGTLVLKPTSTWNGTSYIYTPEAGFTGIETFTYRGVKNSNGEQSNLATVTITVEGVVPVARDDRFVLRSESYFPYLYVAAPGILANDSSANGQFSLYGISNLSDGGRIWMGTDGAIAYYPAANEAMPTSKIVTFQYQFWDGVMASNIATVTLEIKPYLLASSLSFVGNEDTSIPCQLSGRGIAPLSFRVTSQPQNGTLSGTVPDLVYTPNANWNGTDSFNYQVQESDGTASNVGTVSLTVMAVNDPPVANSMILAATEDMPAVWNPSGTDIENSPLAFRVVAQPANGVVAKSTAGVWNYAPNANFNGADSFTYVAVDNVGSYFSQESVPATVSVSVSPVNDAPVATLGNLSTNEDTPLPFVLAGSDIDGDALTFSVVTPPQNGTLSGTAPNLTFTPNLDWNGSTSLAYRVSDGALSVQRTISIVVAPVNDAPRSPNRTFALDEDSPLDLYVDAVDPEGNFPITFSIVTPPGHGTLTTSVYGAPSRYSPEKNFNGTDSFVLSVRDPQGASSTATITFQIRPINDNPYWPSDVSAALNTTTPEDVPVEVTLRATDPENDPLTYSITTVDSYPALANIASAFTVTGDALRFVPPANWSGQVFPSVWASDGQLRRATFPIFTVTPVNDAPVAAPQSLSLDEDTSKTIVLSASDVDSSNLTYSVTSQPQNGTLSGTAPNLIYVPNASFSGTDSFTFTASDGALSSNGATVTLNVRPVNDAPSAASQNLTTNEDTPKNLVLSGSDIDGDTLTFALVTPPAHGTLSGTAPNVSYAPAPNYNGPDSFTFKVSDGTLDSAPTTIAISVTAVNDAPTALSQSVSGDEDTPKSLILSGNDVDGDSLTFSIVTPPVKGVLTGTAPNLTYTPAANAFGSDSITFKVSDGALESGEATVSLSIRSVNDAPTAVSQSLSTDEDTATSVLLAGNDVEGDALTYAITSQPTRGTLSGTAPNLTYTPASNYNGPDSFGFTAADSTLISGQATISIEIRPVNDAPLAESQTVAVTEDSAKSLTLAGNDPENSVLTFAVLTQPLHGALSGTAPNLTYTPAANYFGSDSFTFKVTDGALSSAPATVSISVANLNDAPTASAQSIATDEDTLQSVVLSATDIDGDTLTYSIVAAPTRGTLSGTAPNLTYTPAANYFGSDSFTFKVNDGTLDSAPATVSITIRAINDAPVAASQTVAATEDTAKSVVLSGSDAENSALTFSVLSQPTKGTLSGTAPNLTYTPAANISGSDSFTFKVSDGALSSATATVSISVAAVNDAPTAVNSSISTLEDTAKAVVLSASDIDGPSLSYSIVTPPAKGTLSGTAPNLTYTPTLDANGSDSFVWKASDGSLSATATVSVTITAVNDAPTANAQSVAVVQNTAKAIALSGSDVEGSALTYTIVANPTKGTLSGTGANRTYTPNTGYIGNDSFTFKVRDGALDSAIATVSISVAAPLPKIDVTYVITSQWTNGFNADVTIKNNGPAINGWQLAWAFPGNQKITNLWNGTYTQTLANAKVNNVNSNKAIATGASVTFGFSGSFTGTNAKPTAFTLNGAATSVK